MEHFLQLCRLQKSLCLKLLSGHHHVIDIWKGKYVGAVYKIWQEIPVIEGAFVMLRLIEFLVLTKFSMSEALSCDCIWFIFISCETEGISFLDASLLSYWVHCKTCVVWNVAILIKLWPVMLELCHLGKLISDCVATILITRVAFFACVGLVI
jgi:hypothetical protein